MTARAIVLAPFSNQALRDWPLASYRALAALCIDRLDAEVQFIGTEPHRSAVDAMLRDLPAERAHNLCGDTRWDAVRRLVIAADCVVANNSGIAHLAASLAVPTVCVFAASHNPYEWMPRGAFVSVLFKRTGCSPCGLSHASDCPFDQRCLREITPATVFDAVLRACDEAGATQTVPACARTRECEKPWSPPPSPQTVELPISSTWWGFLLQRCR